MLPIETREAWRILTSSVGSISRQEASKSTGSMPETSAEDTAWTPFHLKLRKKMSSSSKEFLVATSDTFGLLVENVTSMDVTVQVRPTWEPFEWILIHFGVDLQPPNENGWFWSGSGVKIGPTTQRNTGDWSYTGGYNQAQPDNREAAQVSRIIISLLQKVIYFLCNARAMTNHAYQSWTTSTTTVWNG